MGLFSKRADKPAAATPAPAKQEFTITDADIANCSELLAKYDAAPPPS